MKAPHIHKQVFRAPGFGEALARVKEEFGEDAIILSSRELKSGCFRSEVEVVAMPRDASVGWSPPQLSEGQSDGLLERRFRRMGLPAGAAATIASALQSKLGGVPSAMRQAKDALGDVLSEEMVFSGAIASETRAVALVGPTGVGKTTTLAKIAAHEALVKERKVGLISIDGYRIAAAEQLQRYADLIGIPMELAHDAATLGDALRRFEDMELVMIDTAGRSPRDDHAIRKMAECLHGAGEAVEVQLCVTAASTDVELDAICERHMPLAPGRLLITKIDEAVYHGGVIAAQIRTGLPIGYFTTGQRVPEDIEVASARRLSEWLCGEEVRA